MSNLLNTTCDMSSLGATIAKAASNGTPIEHLAEFYAAYAAGEQDQMLAFINGFIATLASEARQKLA